VGVSSDASGTGTSIVMVNNPGIPSFVMFVSQGPIATIGSSHHVTTHPVT
jgi:hypothetical protein